MWVWPSGVRATSSERGVVGSMAEDMGRVRGETATLRSRASLPAMVLLLFGTLGISTAYGMLLLLPLYVQKLGGNEADFGIVMASASVTAAVSIGLVIRYPEALRANVVLAIAVLLYGFGAAGAALVRGTWLPLIGIGLLLGTAWAVVYAASPMVMSEMVTDQERVIHFGYLTGTQQLGIGVGPVVAGFLVGGGLGFRGTFFLAGGICVLAAVLVFGVGRLVSDTRKAVSKDTSTFGSETDAEPEQTVSFKTAMGRILRSETAFWLTMILIFACLFTTLTSFQTTFAAARSLDFSVYFLSYTAAVILSRFGIANFSSRYDTRLVVAVAASVTALSVASFLLVGSNTVLYGLASGFVGIGYGLALPAAQAQAVNVSEQAVRPRVLPLAGLLFETMILAFPLLAGWVIAGFGYGAVFVLLVFLCLMQAGLAWERFLATRRVASPAQSGKSS
jgi:MFS family permease